MKVLVAHNGYSSARPSGENRAVANEIDLLREYGAVVKVLQPSSDAIGRRLGATLAAPFGPIHSTLGARLLKNALTEFCPDVVHLHNPFPLIGPSGISLPRAAGIPVVHSLHNYRMECVSGDFFRADEPCYLCAERGSHWPAIRHGCYRNSRIQTIPMAVSLAHRSSTWRDADLFLTLTDAMSARLERLQIPADRIRRRPQLGPDVDARTVPESNDVLFLGRLSQEKGVDVLLRSWLLADTSPGRSLVIAGDGPLRSQVERVAADESSVRYAGYLDRPAIARELKACGLVVVPSLWPEGYPMAIVEARAAGRAVLCSTAVSASSEITVGDGWVADPTDRSLAQALAEASTTECVRRGGGGRRRYDAEHCPSAVAKFLLATYTELVWG